MTTESKDMSPTPDRAEHNAFFPSPYSLSQYIAPNTRTLIPAANGRC